MCQDILENGTSTEGEKVRPHWEDGTSAYTIKKFGVVNRYDLSKEFPAITLRKTAIKTCTEEMLWIWQRKSNNIHDLNSTVWDEWADENGSIGKAYGYQLAQKHQYREGMMDQVDRVIYDLKNNPFSRRIQPEFRCRMLLTRNQLFYQFHMPVIDMCVRNDMYQFSHFHVTHLCQHMHQHCVLAYIPVICSKHILRTLIQNCI